MISIIIFLIGCVVTLTTSLLVLSGSMNWWLVLIIALCSIVGMIAINGIVALVCCKLLPKKWFVSNSKFYNPSKKECRFYEKLGIKKWKDKNIDLGQLNGFKKDKIENNSEYIQRFILENNMGFVEHFVSAILSFLALFVLPIKFWLPMSLPIVITSLILNLLPIMILRYNMPRLKTLLKFSERNKNNKDSNFV